MDRTHHTREHEAGFTLIEISMVIIIVAVLLTPLIAMYSNYYIGKKITDTEENLTESSSYVSTFFSATGRYPCPADPALPVTDPNYGIEDCTASGAIVSAAGIRTATNLVYIGAIPITTIRNTLTAGGVEGFFPDQSTQDGWNNRLTYAVTSSLTNSSTYKFYDGQIGAIDEYGNNTAGINDDAHYAVISHGKNGGGAYSSSGTVVSACPAATNKENENCDGDATFRSALGVYEGTGVDYFDDYAYFAKSSGAALWNNLAPNHIINLNTKNVGINTSTPTEKLDVSGTIQATNNIKVEKICTTSGSDCFDVKKVSSSGMSCGGVTVMQGITNAGTDCITPSYSTPVDADCSPNWIQGVRSDGCVICSNGTVHC
ncbi:MAG: prepilin-type N-terminal cleavage/methylation domain-containing protein [Pseudobdellovibrionaceae bacterium]|nr:prepilin-type N-terminal cleavage/methylation domain-containing protein [Pseudobdellovibrionaceae bacterium]